MKVYRISRTKYADDLAGTGASLFGGRWNQKLIPCIYTSQSRSLALLEYTVNISIDEIPRALSLVTFDIDEKNIFEVEEYELPGNWKRWPAPKHCQEFGSSLLLNPKISVIKIPSTIIPDEFNYMINPTFYPGKIKILSISDFIYDVRIKAV